MNPHGLLRWLLVCALLLSSHALALPGPELTVQGARGERVPLSIESFEANVLLFDDLAETTITITFHNSESRVIEGEFAMPLPPGATVSGYALDVNGKMRESTVVEKERARFAYESIKRLMIDPGFIEREEGNIYRTKIFPIPANGTKAVRLSYCEAIDPKDGHLDYRLPLPVTAIKNISFEIEHLEGKSLTFVKCGDLTFINEGPGKHVARITRKTLPPELVVRMTSPNESILIRSKDYTYLRKAPKKGRMKIIPEGSSMIEIVWDCSESGRQRNHVKEFAFLDQLFRNHPDLTINLTFLHFITAPGSTFAVKDGDWSKLRKTLEGTFYDGGTNLAAIAAGSHPILVFTDGQSHFASLSKSWTTPVTLIDSTGIAAPYWIGHALESGGHYIDLSKEDPLNHPSSPKREFGFKSELFKNAPGGILSFGNPRVVKLISTHWAQSRLRELESRLIPDSKKIIAHCKKHHLVSDFTSLIVLERFEDYVRYEIPPPEPELRKRYDEKIARKQKSIYAKDPIAKIWNDRKGWHSRFFPWQERILRPSLRRLMVWKKSLEKAFEPAELNPLALRQVEDLEKNINRLFEKRRKKPFEKDVDYRAWLKDLQSTYNKIQDIGILTAGTLSKEKKMAIAVNGFVNQPGKIKAPSNLTLLAAIKEAGGISRLGSGSRVSLYRAAQKTTYNTLSEKFVDVTLMPADLIVVEQAWEDWDDDGVDPFSAGPPPEPVDHRKTPAVVTDFVDPPFISDSGGGDSDPFAGSAPETKNNGVSFAEIPQSSDDDFTVFRKVLEESENKVASYQALRLKPRYPDEFYLQTGDLLITKKKPEFAQRVLSNLIEGPTSRPAAYRKWAYLMARHSDWASAADLLHRIARLYPDDQAIALDQAWVAEKLQQEVNTKNHLARAMESADPGNRDSMNLAEIATTETRPKKDLPLDLRIVVATASGQDLNLRLIEPLKTVARFSNWHGTSQIGGRSFESIGVAEYALRLAVPGSYQLSYQSRTAQLIRIQIYRDWGKPHQTLEEKIISLPAAPFRSIFMNYQFDLK